VQDQNKNEPTYDVVNPTFTGHKVNRVTREDNIVYEDTFPYMVTRGSTILAAPMEEYEINNTGPTSDGYLEPMKFMVATAIIREQESERTYSTTESEMESQFSNSPYSQSIRMLSQ
jgi:hypothetical protein